MKEEEAFFVGFSKFLDVVITTFAIAKEKLSNNNNNNNIALKTNVTCEKGRSDGVHSIR
jgi:hypothetical protein